MSDIRKTGILFLLWSTFAGSISFFVSSVIMAVVISKIDFFIINTIFAGVLGGLFLSIFLLKWHKIMKMMLAGLVAVPIGFWGAFILVEGANLLLSSLSSNSENPNLFGIGNIVAIIIMGIICGAIFGAIIYGRKSILLFAVICGVFSFPFGKLVDLFNSGHPIKATFENMLTFLGSIDLNFIAIMTSFGIGIGISIGLYEKLNHIRTSKS